MRMIDYFTKLLGFSRRPPKNEIKIEIPARWQMEEDGYSLQLLQRHNELRKAANRVPLSLRSELGAVALYQAQWMAQHNELTHNDGRRYGDLSYRITQYGYNPIAGGENIARGGATALATICQWQDSEPHFANMMDRNYWDVGFGHAITATGEHYWCAVYGRSCKTVTPVAHPLLSKAGGYPTPGGVGPEATGH